MKNRNELILLACLFLGITSCLGEQVSRLPTQQMIISEPTLLIAPETNLTTTKYSNSKMCVTENHQGNFLTSFRREFGESPDKTWLFVQCLYEDEKHSHYVLLNQSDSSKSWAIESPAIIQNPRTWYASSWTKDSQTLYLGYRPFCEYAITCMYVDAKAVYRLNSITHQFSSILPFRDDKTQYSLDFSHDARFLAYIITGTQTLYIRDLTTDAEEEIKLNRSENSYGNLHWSPDDNYLVFHSSSKEDILDFSLWLLKKSDFSVVQLMKNEERNFYIAGWSGKNEISLHLSGGKANEPFQYVYDILTKELIRLNEPTSSPTR